MYYAAKALELLGMFMIAVGFAVKFPGLMDPKLLFAGGILFASGWIIEKYILKSLDNVKNLFYHKLLDKKFLYLHFFQPQLFLV